MLESIGLKVNRLIRISYGPFKLGSLKRGEIIEIKQAIIKSYLPKDLVKKIFPAKPAKAK